jgi:hypothetical protein
MSVPAVLAPVFVQVALTFFVLFWMGRKRFAALKTREVRIKDIALGERAWPAQVTQVSNTYMNQFEMPVLFYALVAFALITRTADLLFVAMAWLFVLCRLTHAFIYTTTNNIQRRFAAFLASSIVLMLMWIVFAVRILLSA